MTQVLSVISGKGGTGKTSVCAGLAAALSMRGENVLCIDADVGLRNLDISLGMSNEPTLPFTEVMRGRYPLTSAAFHPNMANLSLLTAPLTERPQDVDPDQFGGLIEMARHSQQPWDFVLIDAPAGIGEGFQLATRFADLAIVVAGGDPASLRDAQRATDVLLSQREVEAKLVVNRVSPRLYAQMRFTIDDAMDGVGLPLLGLVPEDENIILAAVAGRALPHYTKKGAAIALKNIAARLCGKKTPLMRF